MTQLMNLTIKSIILIIGFTFVSSAFSQSYANNDSQYERKFRKNYQKYKSFSPKKKQRMQKLYRSVEGLSDEQKRRLRERVLNKSKPNH